MAEANDPLKEAEKFVELTFSQLNFACSQSDNWAMEKAAFAVANALAAENRLKAAQQADGKDAALFNSRARRRSRASRLYFSWANKFLKGLGPLPEDLRAE